MKTYNYLFAIILTLGFISISQTSYGQEKRKTTKIGVYVFKPIQNPVPDQVQFNMSIPPVTLESERELLPFLSLGTELGAYKMDITAAQIPSTVSENVPFKQSVLGFWGMIKGVGHFKITELVEVYGYLGFGAGKVITTSNNSDWNGAVRAQGLDGGVFKMKQLAVGANLYLSETFGVFGEAGLKDNAGLFKLGVVFRAKK